MKSFYEHAIIKLFDEYSTSEIKSFDEFDHKAGEAAQAFLKPLGAVSADYTVSIPTDIPFSENIPGGGTLFGGETEIAELVRFQHSFDKGGIIGFNVYFGKGKIITDDERAAVNEFFVWLFHSLEEAIMADTYKKLVLVEPGTGAANPTAFMQFAELLAATGQIRSYTAIYFNIRNFKSINKTLTYNEGNVVMKKYCNIVSDALSRRELVVRLGVDNFAAFVLDDNKDYFLDLLQNVVVKYEKDGEILTFVFGATMGITKLTNETDGGEVMLRISTAFQAAREKRAMMSYYDRKTELEIMERKLILSKFHNAINTQEFFLMYQPKVSVKTRRLVGAEALVRWKHDGGCIMPGSFISALERDGSICELDFYVLDKACGFLRQLIDDDLEPVKISVNFSKRHLTNNKLVEEIVETIDKYKIPHSLVEVELTESEDFHNQDIMKDVVDELSAQGIKSSIDDFGTGYSSLVMLSTLELEELKIDKSFIPDNIGDKNDKKMLMLEGVINLAKSLGLTTVAEGVETPEQLKLVESLGCDIVQGYVFDKPLSNEDFIRRIRNKVYVFE